MNRCVLCRYGQFSQAQSHIQPAIATPSVVYLSLAPSLIACSQLLLITIGKLAKHLVDRNLPK